MIVKFYQWDKYGENYLGEKEMDIIPRKGERIIYDTNYGSSWYVHMIIWDIDIGCVTIRLTGI